METTVQMERTERRARPAPQDLMETCFQAHKILPKFASTALLVHQDPQAQQGTRDPVELMETTGPRECLVVRALRAHLGLKEPLGRLEKLG